MDRFARGDFQTPPELARWGLARLDGPPPATVVEPTCGSGAFLGAAGARWPEARRLGWEIEATYLDEARATGAEVQQADVFAADWEALAAGWRRPVTIVGNPPWVTVGGLGRRGADNRPRGQRGAPGEVGPRGLDALTGASNFDLAEWIVRRLLLAAPDARLAMLIKTSVARRLLRDGLPVTELWPIDAPRWFGAAVDAAWVVIAPGGDGRCAVRTGEGEVLRWLAVDGDRIVEDAALWARWRHLAGDGPRWRSGVKHDAARILEVRDGRNGLGAPVDVEPDACWPLLKGGDLHHGRAATRRLILPQRRLGEDPGWLAAAAPRAWAYLERHGEALDRRRSRIYQGQPRFAVFGVGPYTFAPYKVAVAGLYPDLRFRLVGPTDGRPVVLDDTCYFLPFDDEAAATDALARLRSEGAQGFLRAQMARGAKRPVTARLLRSLDLGRVAP